jgi:hypothetical protein
VLLVAAQKFGGFLDADEFCGPARILKHSIPLMPPEPQNY